MFTTKALFFLLAIALYVQALPHQHGRAFPAQRHHARSTRRGCKSHPPKAALAAPSTTLVAGAAPTAGHNVTKGETNVKPPTSTEDDEDDEDVPTTTKNSGAQPTPDKSDSPKAGLVAGILGSLFPVSSFSKSWTTSPASDDARPLSDSTLRPTKVLSSLSHDYVAAPDGKKGMKAHYPAGSYTFGHQPQGGFSFYAPGPTDVDLSTAKEATFGYSVYFPANFEFQLGGKLPGIYGGDNDEVAVSCSGGRRDARCFSVRLMWREGGKGEFYTYLPDYTNSKFSANKKLCNVAPQSDCNPTYGASVGRGAFTFARGKWTTISERVRLNTPGKADGELELFVNGKSVINVSGVILTDSEEGSMRGLQMQTFFGGSSLKFASPKTQDVWFSDFSVAITERK